MPGVDRTKKLLIRPHRWLINFIGVIVPRRLRADWKQGWQGELQHREASLEERIRWRRREDL
jgi:hypothetical protein